VVDELHILAQGGGHPTPAIEFDRNSGILTIAGASHPDNAAAFYAPLILWLDALIAGPPRTVRVELRLSSFGPSTRPQLLALLRRLRAWTRRGAAVSVRWFVDPRDDDMVDTAADFQTMSGLPIHIISAAPAHQVASAY
jgi:hypothetical protein